MGTSDNHAFSLSIDWEDFGQLLGRDYCGTVTPPLKNIDRQTDIILELLDNTGKKATFFILGMLAQYRPDLVKKIAAEGHEIGLHGQHHINMRSLSYKDAFNDIKDSFNLVTDIIGEPVFGYRAPYFSIDETNMFLLEILSELGLLYDSSIFPIKLKRYGIAGFSTEDTLYKLPNGKEIVELPLTVAAWRNRKLPVAGGGYMRAFPSLIVDRIFRDLDHAGKNVMLYMHPYEFDTEWIDCSANYPENISYSRPKTFLINLRWNLFRNSIRKKLENLLTKYHFLTCQKKAENVKNRTHSPAILGRS
jgi:polysaccharide deacetylase family protein (PEP-CTERM system associated)